jgi:radical SAM protein with 4Fe4S-binding SPASM domain
MDRRIDIAREPRRPIYVVWELTLACDQGCLHCGSRAARPRAEELTVAEALALVDQLADLGAREVALMGGEAYLFADLPAVVAALAARGIRPLMVTGGRGITAERARQLADAGMHSVSVSIDGVGARHDRIRYPGSFAAATAALDHLAAAGLRTGSNINLNRWNADDLESVYDHLRAHGVTAWQVQLTAPLGRAGDRPEMLLQPYQLLDLVPRVAALKRRGYRDGLLVMPGNNLGYFGPEEALLRSQTPDGADHWVACLAGRYVLGIESDGGVKPCASLDRAYRAASVRERPLAEIWREPAMAAVSRRGVDDLWGYCRQCDFGEVCLGGCTFTAHALFGRPGNNPYCHYRARRLAAAGQRERLVQSAAPPGQPFDHGCFEIALEPWPEGPAALERRR